MNLALAIAFVLVGGALTIRFRAVADGFDAFWRGLADGPGRPEPERRGVVGQFLMVGTGRSTAARWSRYAATLLVGMLLLGAGAGAVAGLWSLV